MLMWYKVYSVVRLVEPRICGRFNHSVCWNWFSFWWLWPLCFAVALANNSHSFAFRGCLRFNSHLRKVCTLNTAAQIIVIPTTLCSECKLVLIGVIWSNILRQKGWDLTERLHRWSPNFYRRLFSETLVMLSIVGVSSSKSVYLLHL